MGGAAEDIREDDVAQIILAKTADSEEDPPSEGKDTKVTLVRYLIFLAEVNVPVSMSA